MILLTAFNPFGLETIAATAAENQDNPDDGTAVAISEAIKSAAAATIATAATAAEEKQDNNPAASSIVA